MTWREAKYFIAGVTLASLSIGLYFLWLGYPMVLPFSGLEALAVAVAFYLVLESGECTEVITISERYVVIEKGKREPSHTAKFERTWTSISLRPAWNNWYPSRLLVGSHGKFVEIGQFLSEGERKALAKMLINVKEKNR
jgi:uncharacterized membrane protein